MFASEQRMFSSEHSVSSEFKQGNPKGELLSYTFVH
jgi:hypothetical protein